MSSESGSSKENEPPAAERTGRIQHYRLIDSCEESLFRGTDRSDRDSEVHVGLPYPIHQSLKTSEDLVAKMLKEKQRYNASLNARRSRYMKYDKVRVNEKEYHGQKYVYIPRYVIDHYDEEEPEDRYKGDYNHYYTGNMEHFKYDNIDYLVRPDVENRLCINRVPTLNTIDKVVQTNYTADSIIYGIDCKETTDVPYLVLREKNRVTTVTCDNIGNVTKRYSRAYKQPIFDAKMSEDFKLGIVFSNQKFSVRDMEVDMSLFSLRMDLDSDVDNFQQFRFLDNQTVLLMGRSNIHILDLRTHGVSESYKPKLLPCNPMYNFVVVDNQVILASRHYIYRTDLRDFEDCSFYSHMIRNAPCYIDYTTKGCDTYMVVCGQSFDNRSLFTGESPFSLPFDIPNLKQTLDAAKRKKPSLVSQDHLESRLQYCLTGCKILNIHNDICMFTSNCFGEIFQQNVYEEEPRTAEAITRMFDWSKTVDNPKPELHATHFEEIADIKSSLNKPVEENEFAAFNKPSKEKEFLKKFEVKYSTKNVKSELAKDFLSVWEDTEEEQVIETLPEEPAIDKVKDWIELHNFKSA